MENNTNEVAVISSTEALQAVTSAEIDKQIATAKAYPRDPVAAVAEMQQLALFDEETAESCFYLKGGENLFCCHHIIKSTVV